MRHTRKRGSPELGVSGIKMLKHRSQLASVDADEHECSNTSIVNRAATTSHIVIAMSVRSAASAGK